LRAGGQGRSKLGPPMAELVSRELAHLNGAGAAQPLDADGIGGREVALQDLEWPVVGGLRHR